jgi:glucosamine-6-phosphate deaminase
VPTTIKLDFQRDAIAVARKAADTIAGAVRANPAVVLGLATGSTPEGTYAELIRIHKEEGLSFVAVTTFNLDEYLGLSGDHSQSYRQFMQTRLFNHIDTRPWNTHCLNGLAADPELEAEAFETKIRSCGGVDLWLLGVGSNGHIAFNEPGSPPDCRTRVISLTSETIAANSDGRFYSDPKDVPRQALTAGIATIYDARSILLLATGAHKAAPIAAAVEGSPSPECPASFLQGHADCTFILDADAAGDLSAN